MFTHFETGRTAVICMLTTFVLGQMYTRTWSSDILGTYRIAPSARTSASAQCAVSPRHVSGDSTLSTYLSIHVVYTRWRNVEAKRGAITLLHYCRNSICDVDLFSTTIEKISGYLSFRLIKVYYYYYYFYLCSVKLDFVGEGRAGVK